MKLLLSAFSILAFLLVIFYSPISAQTATEGARPLEKIRERVQESQRKEKIGQRKEEVKKKVAGKRAENVKRHLSRLVKRFGAMINRLVKLADRIGSRIDKLEAKGANVAAARAQLEQARTKITTVKADIDLLAREAETIVSSEDPKASFAQVKQRAKGIKNQLVEVHRLLGSSLGQVKGLSGDRKSATGGANEK